MGIFELFGEAGISPILVFIIYNLNFNIKNTRYGTPIIYIQPNSLELGSDHHPDAIVSPTNVKATEWVFGLNYVEDGPNGIKVNKIWRVEIKTCQTKALRVETASAQRKWKSKAILKVVRIALAW